MTPDQSLDRAPNEFAYGWPRSNRQRECLTYFKPVAAQVQTSTGLHTVGLVPGADSFVILQT